MTQPRDLSALMPDIVDACAHVSSFIHGRTRDEFVGDIQLRYAVERALVIAGEALTAALRLDPSLETRISDTQGIIGLRNHLVHGYSLTSPDTIWDIAVAAVPVLAQQAAQILAELTPGDPPC
jgi:uncharacterized protein with HEPN domain